MTVHFIGAGPGAADLITLRARDLIAACPVCLYAGSLVPEAILAHCPEGARIVNTAPLDLDAIIAECSAAHENVQDVARLHSGDLSVWSAMGEQMERLKAEGIPVSVTPGVPAFAAAAAAFFRFFFLLFFRHDGSSVCTGTKSWSNSCANKLILYFSVTYKGQF